MRPIRSQMMRRLYHYPERSKYRVVVFATNASEFRVDEIYRYAKAYYTCMAPAGISL